MFIDVYFTCSLVSTEDFIYKGTQSMNTLTRSQILCHQGNSFSLQAFVKPRRSKNRFGSNDDYLGETPVGSLGNEEKHFTAARI